MPRTRSLLVLAATAGAATATPTLHADQPCYTQGQPISLTGGGFTAGGPIPFRPVRAGQWTVYFSPTQVFDRGDAWIRVRVRVPRSKAVPAAR